MSPRPSVSRRGGSALLAFGVLALALTGCVPDGTPHTSSSPDSTTIATPTDSPTASVTPSPTPTAGSAAVPTAIACNSIASPQTIYDFNPNYTLQLAFSPASGTAAYTAKADGGTACNWVNNTSGENLTISIARPGSVEFASLAAGASSGTPVSGYGDHAYFSGTRFDAFKGRYWVVAVSSAFGSANDASSLMASALASVG